MKIVLLDQQIENDQNEIESNAIRERVGQLDILMSQTV